MRKLLSFAFAVLIAGFVFAAPVAYKRWHDKEYRNFHVVEEGVLYRSGQMPFERMEEFVTTHGIRTIVCLRHGNDPADQREESWIKECGLNFVRIPPLSWWPDETGKVPSEASLQKFRDVMDDPANYPVLVHCFAGIHRTGGMCAIFRMDYQGWTNEQAMNEMRVLGYSILDDHEDVHGFLVKYQPQRATKRPAVLGQPVGRNISGP